MKQPGQYFEIAELITKFLEGKLSPEESAKLRAWVDENKRHQKIWERLINPDYLEDHIHFWENNTTAGYWKQLEEALSRGDRTSGIISLKKTVRKSLRYAAVIIPLLLLCGAGWYLMNRGHKSEVQNHQETLADVHIMPLGKVARLVLGNGKVVSLNDSLQETITEKDGTRVKNGSNAISYSGSDQSTKEAVYNTLITPRGGEYEIVLADGTKVWLNAASSLHYPVRFSGKERQVSLKGEAYFEVAKDERHPFVVNAGNTNVTVLGTKFDISAYNDDPSQKVVLAEGAVRVNEINDQASEKKSVLLKPGFVAVIKGNYSISVNKADVEAALGWKNGLFLFDGESLGSIMRKLSRWYNVEVKYNDGADTLFHFTGRIQRYENITGILKLIELTGKVKFGVIGKEVVVMPVK